jgi:hypothetical protein
MAHFTVEELCRSDTVTHRNEDKIIGNEIDNTPNEIIRSNLVNTTIPGMDKVREILGNNPIKVNSGYRSAALNLAIGGSATSAHTSGYAVDFTCKGFGTPTEIVRCLMLTDLVYDQLIDEGTWVHISFDPRRKRRQTLKAKFTKGKASFEPFI